MAFERRVGRVFDSNVLILLLLGAVVFFWVDSVRAKEVATTKAKELCSRYQVQFLDDSAALARLRLGRTSAGLRFQRSFNFGYYRDDLGRRQGNLTLLGMRVHSYQIDANNVIEADFWRS